MEKNLHLVLPFTDGNHEEGLEKYIKIGPEKHKCLFGP